MKTTEFLRIWAPPNQKSWLRLWFQLCTYLLTTKLEEFIITQISKFLQFLWHSTDVHLRIIHALFVKWRLKISLPSQKKWKGINKLEIYKNFQFYKNDVIQSKPLGNKRWEQALVGKFYSSWKALLCKKHYFWQGCLKIFKYLAKRKPFLKYLFADSNFIEKRNDLSKPLLYLLIRPTWTCQTSSREAYYSFGIHSRFKLLFRISLKKFFFWIVKIFIFRKTITLFSTWMSSFYRKKKKK